ncbi:MAG: hypothetical protein H7Y01_15770 [Ferruginibacter sp.]|nr:hypothetical protein [Chitinophagaceae bacterium]
MDPASQIKKQYGEISFDNPVIIFRYQRIDIETTGTLVYLHIAALFFVPFLFLVLKEIHPVVYVLLFIASFFLIFRLSSGLNKIEIDFFYNRIRIKNKFSLINSIRKLLKRPGTLFFHNIAGIYTTKGIYYGRNQIRNFLVIKLINHRTLRLSHFISEKDAQSFAELLQKHIVGQPELNK